MSRTFAHRPERARFDDPSSCVPVHDHRDGPCDLPTLVEWHDWVNHGDGEQPWRCEWELSWYLWPKLCSCRTCSDYYWNRENRRRNRHRSKVWLTTGAWIEEWVDPAGPALSGPPAQLPVGLGPIGVMPPVAYNPPEHSAVQTAEVPPEWGLRGVHRCLVCKRSGGGRS